MLPQTDFTFCLLYIVLGPAAAAWPGSLKVTEAPCNLLPTNCGHPVVINETVEEEWRAGLCGSTPVCCSLWFENTVNR